MQLIFLLNSLKLIVTEYEKQLKHILLRVHLNGIFAPLNAGLVQVSRSHFKQSLCYRVFCKFFGDFWVYLGGIVFLKGLEKFREIRKIEDLMKLKN